MTSRTAFLAMLNRQPPNTYFHPEPHSSFPTTRYPFLIFCLHTTYEELERNQESKETLQDFLRIAKIWVKNLPFDAGKNSNFNLTLTSLFAAID
jgi:hypothetical protein